MYDLKPDRSPFIFTNFVMTLDGKVNPPTQEYWPFGSEKDFHTLLELRSQADVMIHGKHTAMAFRHLKRLTSDQFQDLRKKYGKAEPYVYVVLSAHPTKELIDQITPPDDKVRVILGTTETAVLPEMPDSVEVWKLGKQVIDVSVLVEKLAGDGLKIILPEGGPHVLGSFLQAELIDEIFLTLAPKILGASPNTLTLVEGALFEPQQVPLAKLLSANQHGDELYLRYSLREGRG